MVYNLLRCCCSCYLKRISRLQVATGKKKIADLEDEILRLLSESTGSLLDDMNLVNTLQDSKTISEEVTQQLQA